ncbi:MAG: RICIN domain-containing protein [Acetobacteraceae bacterium]
MRNHRFAVIFLATAMASAGGLAFCPAGHAEDPIVKLVSVQNGKCLQPLGRSSDRGVAIIQKACDGSTAQQWTVTLVSSTKAHLVNRSSRLCLDARGKAVNGTPIQQWPCNKISNEDWSFGIRNNLLSSGISGTFSHCVATPGSQDGLPTELRFCDGNITQLWNRPPG